VIAAIVLFAAILAQPSVMFLALESALLGVVLTLFGLVIEHLVERTRWSPARPRRLAIAPSRPGPDSTLDRSPIVGSDDSTAIRARPASTLDYVPVEIAAAQAIDDPRAPSLEGT
jgi:hypothetical protein